MQCMRQGYTTHQISCQFASCGCQFKSVTGLKMHLRSVHSHHFNVADDTEQPLPPDVVWAYHEKLTSFSSLFALAVIKSHPTGKICNANGMDLPEGTPPLPTLPRVKMTGLHIGTSSSLRLPSTSFLMCRHQQVKLTICFTYGDYLLQYIRMNHHLRITRTSMKPLTQPQ